ncbi:hypothetical protein [Glycomyces salinus]|uniref:hypothetical protein n=1 Tax=Glycomyces salinus TaxID=980294 RepID=UPI0018EBEB8A|nr:hypothetical protein [Glycomyces salinus]
MNIRNNLHKQWSATAQAAQERLSKITTSFDAEFAENRSAAYEDGARTLCAAVDIDDVMSTLRERMRDTSLRTRRNYYAYMLNDLESALDSGQHGEGRFDES